MGPGITPHMGTLWAGVPCVCLGIQSGAVVMLWLGVVLCGVHPDLPV